MYAHKLAYYTLDNKIVDKRNVGTVNPCFSNNTHFIWGGLTSFVNVPSKANYFISDLAKEKYVQSYLVKILEEQLKELRSMETENFN